MGIPKRIFLTYKTKKIPDYIVPLYKSLNPEWDVVLYDDQDCVSYLRKHFGSFAVNFFKKVPWGPIKSDFWRICVLYKEGGIYCDIDLLPLVPIKKIMEHDVDFCTCIAQSKDHLFQAWLASVPKHPILKQCIKKMEIKANRFFENPKSFQYRDMFGGQDMWEVLKSKYNIDPLSSRRYRTRDGIIKLLQEEGDAKEMYKCFASYRGEPLFLSRTPFYDAHKHQFHRLNHKDSAATQPIVAPVAPVAMKGSFITTTRNFKCLDPETRLAEMELRNRKGEWIKTKIHFVPHLEYINNDGYLEWVGNHVPYSAQDTSLGALQSRYPPISISCCLQNFVESDLFDIQKKHRRVKHKKAIFISLFKQHKSNDQTWKDKYLNSLLSNLEQSRELLPDYEINLYLDHDLQDLYDKCFRTFPNLNVSIMKNSSKYEQPGMMWRFLELQNRRYRLIVICDIDESWDWVKQWESQMDHSSVLLTCYPVPNHVEQQSKVSVNYTTVLGSHIMFRPRKCHSFYDMRKVLIGFIFYCQSLPPFTKQDQVTVYNHPIHNRPRGWGSKYPEYGFDEHFLKHVFVYTIPHKYIKFV